MPRPDVLKKGVDTPYPVPVAGRFPAFLVASIALHGLLLVFFTVLWRPPILLTLTRAQIGIVHVDDKTLQAIAAAGSVSGGGGGTRTGKAGGGHALSRGPKLSGMGGDLWNKSPLGEMDDNPSRESSAVGGTRGLREGLGTGIGGDGTTTGYRGETGAPGVGFGRERAGTRSDGGGERAGTGTTPPSAIQWNEGSTVRQVSSQPELEWPESLRGKAIRAEVLVSVTVDPSGRILSPVIQRSSGSGDLDRAVLDAVRRTLFQASGGDAPSYGTIRYTFKY